jgi:hypothetical protein
MTWLALRKLTLSLASVTVGSFLSGYANAAEIPDAAKRCVAFIVVHDGRGNLIPNGTGFFVSVPNEVDPTKSNLYLVTAKHVLSRGVGDTLFQQIVVRVNRQNGGVDASPISLSYEGNGKNVHFPVDESIDIAAIPVAANIAVVDIAHIPIDLVTSADDFRRLAVTEGTDVFFAGLFTPHIGSIKNYPIVRFGRVALLSEEKINWDGVPTDLYLIESASYGGNSGAPVFIQLGPIRGSSAITIGAQEIRLAGVMKGAFEQARPLVVANTDGLNRSISNIGIAAVSPAYHLRALLLSPDLVEQRKRSVRASR